MSSYYEVRSPEYLQILPIKQMLGSGVCSNKGNVCGDGKVRSPEYLLIGLNTKHFRGTNLVWQ